MEIKDGIHLVEGVRGANAYIVTASDGLAVVDAGLPGSSERIIEYAKRIGFSPSQIKTIILTHPDIDHAGGVLMVREMTGASVAIHEADAARLSGEKGPKKAKGAMGVLIRIGSGLMRPKPVKADIMPKDGDKIAGLTVIYTPGHTEGSISLLSPGGVLFVGDALRTSKDGKPELPRDAMNADTELAKESVKKIAKLDFSVLLPGHGAPILVNASALVKELVTSDFR